MRPLAAGIGFAGADLAGGAATAFRQVRSSWPTPNAVPRSPAPPSGSPWPNPSAGDTAPASCCSGGQMPLERLQLLAVLKADDEVGPDRLLDRDRRHGCLDRLLTCPSPALRNAANTLEISAGTSAVATTLLPTKAPTISVVRLSSSCRLLVASIPLCPFRLETSSITTGYHSGQLHCKYRIDVPLAYVVVVTSENTPLATLALRPPALVDRSTCGTFRGLVGPSDLAPPRSPT